MKKTLLLKSQLFLILVFIFQMTFGQCPDSDLTFETQEEIDQFLEDYPDCTELDVHVTIGTVNPNTTDITNLNGLENITAIHASLTIRANGSLVDLQGLLNLTTIEDNFRIEGNDALQNFNGLDNLNFIGGYFTVLNNDALDNFEGISNLSAISEDLLVKGNTNLENFAGATSLMSVGGYLKVEENSSLLNFSGLDNLTNILGNLEISSNNNLQNLQGLGSLFSIGENLIINENNALQNFAGINNLETVGFFVNIRLNENLSSLEGLTSLYSVGHYFRIEGNHNLTNLSGLEALTTIVNYLSILNNNGLLNLEGLNNLNLVEGDLYIGGNDLLTDCSAICEFLIIEDSVGGTITIQENLTGCNSLAEIETDCNCQNEFPEDFSLSNLIFQCSATEEEITVPTISNSCDETITATTETDLNFEEFGEFQILWNFENSEGEIMQYSQTIIIQDTIDPVTPTLLELTENCELVVTEEMFPTTEDNCAGIITATTESNLVFDEIGIYEIEWIFTDSEGNSVSTIQIVNIVDTVNPEIPELEQLTENCELVVTEEMFPTTEDNCTGIITATTESNLVFDQVGEYEIEWIFTDNDGNSVSSIQIINIIDEENPEIPILETLTLECNNSEDLVATTFDNCDGVIEGVLESNDLAEGENIVTWIFEDSSGNSVTANQTIILIDDAAPTPPVIPITFAECEFTVTTVPTAYDLCSDVIIVTHDQESLTYNSPGEYFIVWTFEDDNGNISETTQVIVIEDTEAPTFVNCPENEIIDLNIACEYEIPDFTDFDFDLMDNCSNEISIIQTPEAGTIITENTEITISFTDDAENESQCNFIIEIVDTTAPEIECPGTQNILVEADESYTLEDFTTEIPVLNACDNYTITQNPEAETELEIGYHVVTLEIIDDFGNTQSCQFIVNVTTDLDISETEIENQISIYPNPATDILKIESLQEIQNVYVLDLNGKIILKQKYENQNIDVSNIYRGMYFVKIETKNKSILQKILLK